MSHLHVLVEGSLPFVQRVSQVLPVIRDVLKDVTEFWVIQGRKSTDLLVARVQTLSAGRSDRIALYTPKPQVDLGFYKMCRDFSVRLAAQEKVMLPKLAEACQQVLLTLPELDDAPSLRQVQMLFKAIIKPLHIFACEIAAMQDFQAMKHFYEQNLPYKLSKRGEVEELLPSIVVRAGLEVLFGHGDWERLAGWIEGFRERAAKAYRSALSGNIMRHASDLLDLMLEAHQILISSGKPGTPSPPRRLGDALTIDKQPKPPMYS